MLSYVECIYVLIHAKRIALKESRGDHYSIACLADKVVRCDEITENEKLKLYIYAVREQLVSRKA
jgi:hypothetical protein